MTRAILAAAFLHLFAATAHSARTVHDRFDIDRLNERGFLVLPADTLFTPELLDETAQSLLLPQSLALATHKYGGPNDHIWELLIPIHDPEHKRLLGSAVRMADQLTDYLGGKLRGEDLAPLSIEARAAIGTGSSGAVGHTDTGYLTAILSLRGSSTRLYRESGDRFITFHAPEHSIVILSNRDRQALLGTTSGLHSAPFGIMKDRVLLLLRFGDAYVGPPEELIKRVTLAARERERQLNEFLRRIYPDRFPL